MCLTCYCILIWTHCFILIFVIFLFVCFLFSVFLALLFLEVSFWVYSVCPASSLDPLFHTMFKPLSLSHWETGQVDRSLEQTIGAASLAARTEEEGKGGDSAGSGCAEHSVMPLEGANGRESRRAYSPGHTKTPAQTRFDFLYFPNPSPNSLLFSSSSAFSIPARDAPMARTKGAVTGTPSPAQASRPAGEDTSCGSLAARARVFSKGPSSPLLGKSLKIAMATGSKC